MERCQILLRGGSFSYELRLDWAKWPEKMGNRAVSGIALHPDGMLYVSTRSERYPICVFDKDGNCVRTFGAELDFSRTHGLTVDLDGNIWVCDDQNSVIYHLDKEGKLLGTMGEKGVFSDSGYDPTVRWPHDLYTNVRAAEPFNRPRGCCRLPGEICTVRMAMEIRRFTALRRKESCFEPGAARDGSPADFVCPIPSR